MPLSGVPNPQLVSMVIGTIFCGGSWFYSWYFVQASISSEFNNFVLGMLAVVGASSAIFATVVKGKRAFDIGISYLIICLLVVGAIPLSWFKLFPIVPAAVISSMIAHVWYMVRQASRSVTRRHQRKVSDHLATIFHLDYPLLRKPPL